MHVGDDGAGLFINVDAIIAGIAVVILPNKHQLHLPIWCWVWHFHIDMQHITLREIQLVIASRIARLAQKLVEIGCVNLIVISGKARAVL